MLVVVAAVMQQLAAALAVTAFPVLGAVGIVAIRFLVASFTLCLVVRPRVHYVAITLATIASVGAVTQPSWRRPRRGPIRFARCRHTCAPSKASVAHDESVVVGVRC
jgi:inner membrane transporter RhtA